MLDEDGLNQLPVRGVCVCPSAESGRVCSTASTLQVTDGAQSSPLCGAGCLGVAWIGPGWRWLAAPNVTATLQGSANMCSLLLSVLRALKWTHCWPYINLAVPINFCGEQAAFFMMDTKRPVKWMYPRDVKLQNHYSIWTFGIWIAGQAHDTN